MASRLLAGGFRTACGLVSAHPASLRSVSSPLTRGLLQRASAQRTVLNGQKMVSSPLRTQMRGFAKKPKSEGLPVVAISAGVIAATGVVGIFLLGAPDVEVTYSPDGQPIIVPPPQESFQDTIYGYVNRALSRARKVYEELMNPPEEDLLPDLTPNIPTRGYTIVLDLEDTLVHTEWTPQHGWRTIKRPGVDVFLQALALDIGYEIVIFSDKEVMDSAPLIGQLDPHGMALFRLFRGHKRKVDGDEIKDLDYLNRDLRKVIIVDDDPTNFKKHPNNGVRIKPFTGDINDRELMKLIPFLKGIVVHQIQDVREVIEPYEGADNIGEIYTANRLAMLENQEKQEQEAQKAPPRRRGLLGSLLAGKQ